MLDLAGPQEPHYVSMCRRGVRVVVPDVANDPLFDGSRMREVLLGDGLHAMQCTPLPGEDGRCLGVLATYHGSAERMPTEARCAELDRLAGQTGRWLEWHRRDAILVALATMHRRAVRG